MSDEPLNPYAAPAPGYVPKEPAPGTKPAWYTFFCVVAMILGSLGVMSGLIGIPGLIFGQSMQPNFQPPPGQKGVSQEMVDEINEMQADIQAINDRYFYPAIIQQVLLIAVALLLLIGAIQAMQMKRWGAKLLMAAFLVAAIFDVGRLVVTTFQMMEMRGVVQKNLGPLLEEASKTGPQPAPPGMGETFGIMADVFFGSMVCLTVGWTLMKLVFYLTGWFYLQKPQVQAILKEA